MIEKFEQQATHNQNLLSELTHQALVKDGGDIIGESPKINQLKQEIDIVSGSDFNVLIYGETGVGKELVARTLHQKSQRNQGPLVYVNCAALPDNLIESELFGHVKGAFTGADKNRDGKFLLADGGTLFLDEIGELPLAAQSKILRSLQNNEIQPVGQDKIKHVDVRILAATNRDLKIEVEQGKFRADLYHRLSVYPITVPPLRERQTDVAILAGYFIEQSKRKLGFQQLKITSSTITYLSHYDWPGNVRELEHVINRAALKAGARNRHQHTVCIEKTDCGVLTGSASEQTSSHLPVPSKPHETVNLKHATEQFQRQLITNTLQQENGNWAASARRLDMDRANLSRTAKRLGIKVTKTVQNT